MKCIYHFIFFKIHWKCIIKENIINMKDTQKKNAASNINIRHDIKSSEFVAWFGLMSLVFRKYFQFMRLLNLKFTILVKF